MENCDSASYKSSTALDRCFENLDPAKQTAVVSSARCSCAAWPEGELMTGDVILNEVAEGEIVEIVGECGELCQMLSCSKVVCH